MTITSPSSINLIIFISNSRRFNYYFVITLIITSFISLLSTSSEWFRTDGSGARLFSRFPSGIWFCRRNVLHPRNSSICSLFRSPHSETRNLNNSIRWSFKRAHKQSSTDVFGWKFSLPHGGFFLNLFRINKILYQEGISMAQLKGLYRLFILLGL